VHLGGVTWPDGGPETSCGGADVLLPLLELQVSKQCCLWCCAVGQAELHAAAAAAALIMLHAAAVVLLVVVVLLCWVPVSDEKSTYERLCDGYSVNRQPLLQPRRLTSLTPMDQQVGYSRGRRQQPSSGGNAVAAAAPGHPWQQ